MLLYDASANTVPQSRARPVSTFAGNAVANVREFTTAPRTPARNRLSAKNRPV
ncbi:MAG: hypothetical protein U0835_26775 [Isosphaeraceae bacterium]